MGSIIMNTGGPYNAYHLDAMLKRIKPGSVVVDAGMNFGSYAVFFAAAVGPHGQVWGFEPQARMFHIACAQAAANGFSNVLKAQHGALSFAKGEITMSAMLPDGSAGGQQLKDVEAKGEKINYGGLNMGKGGERAPAYTLDSFGLANVSFIKVDVQGAEQLMFYGAQDTIRRNKPACMYESTGYRVTQDMIDTLHIPKDVLDFNVSRFFQDLGYTAVSVGPEDVMQVPPGSQP